MKPRVLRGLPLRLRAGCRTISLDPFTVTALCQYVEMIDNERDAFGTSYPDHGKLMCFEDGRRLHPDTVMGPEDPSARRASHVCHPRP